MPVEALTRSQTTTCSRCSQYYHKQLKGLDWQRLPRLRVTNPTISLVALLHQIISLEAALAGILLRLAIQNRPRTLVNISTCHMGIASSELENSIMLSLICGVVAPTMHLCGMSRVGLTSTQTGSAYLITKGDDLSVRGSLNIARPLQG